MIGRRRAVVAALIVMAIVGAVAIWALRITQRVRSEAAAARAVNFQARDWVLISRFENRTGDPGLDGVLEYALERELANSRFVNVVPRERIEDALRLMKKPLDTTIDGVVGREISLRDGGIRALITGRADKVGSRYLLSGKIVDPTLGVAVGALSEEADGPDQVLRGVRGLANGLRARLGETLQSIQAGDQKLERASTPSLRALRLYSQALDFEYHSKWAPAAELLRQAIAEDPEFATAQIHLAWALRNQRQPQETYLPHAQHALELSDRTPEGERYFIRGSYLNMVGKDAEAVAAYEALLSLYPDHYWAVNNAALSYEGLGRGEQAIPYLVRRADLRPYDFRAQLRAAQRLASVGGNLREASELARRARQRVAIATAEDPALSLLALLAAYERWLNGDVEGADQEVRAVARTLTGRAQADQYGLALNVGNFCLALGKLKDAETAVRHAEEPAYLVVVAFARGDQQALQKHIRDADIANSPGRGPLVAMLEARVGLFREAERVIKSLKRPTVTIPYGSLKAAEGELALRRGDQARGVALLEKAMQDLRPSGSPDFFFAAESLAEVYVRRGRYSESVRVLEAASKERSRSYTSIGSSGMFWIRTQAKLAELYRRVGREQEARVIDAELLKLLAFADPDYPLLVELKARPRELVQVQRLRRQP